MFLRKLHFNRNHNRLRIKDRINEQDMRSGILTDDKYRKAVDDNERQENR